MIVADRKKVREIRDMIKDHHAGAAGGLRHLRHRVPGRRRARSGHPGLGPANVAAAGRAAQTWWSTSAPSSGNARTRSSTPWPRGSAEYDAICSLGCGAGVQALAERFPKTPVYPGLNTQFIGILESQGVWTEKCAGCGNCRLGEFAGICPITRCAKRLFNGPCGGSQDGKCEVNPDLDCGWQLIYDRAKSTGNRPFWKRSPLRRTGRPVWTAARARWSARTSASPAWGRRRDVTL